ncbi:Kelch repeat-containing protein [Prosthecobacter sp.]|uniref:Kelch repeat-containing protein n=1 Tax=Prosthecobacter sp. TaxID=1965333 RepID=UPI003784CF89
MKALPLISLFLLAFPSLLTAGDAPPEMPLAVASFGATGMPDGTLYFYGGHSGKRHKYNRDEVHGDLFRWKQGTEQWEALTKDEPAQGASLVTVKDGVIRIGGMAARNAKGEKQDLWSSETAARYDIATGNWIPLPKMPQRRSSHDSIVCGSTLYVVGGWRMEGDADSVWHDTYLTLDLSKADAKWESHPQPFKRRALAVQALGTQVYAIGGMTDEDKTTSAVSVLDATTGTWREGPELPAEKIGGFGFAAVAHDGRLFASGVKGTLLELRGGQWVAVAKLAHPRYFHRLLIGGTGKIIALGGESGEGAKAPPEVIDLPAANSAPLPEAPAAAKAASKRS